MTTATATPLAVGDLVTYRGHDATVHQPTDSDAGTMHDYVLLRFTDAEHAPTGAWQDRGYPSEHGERFYWVGREDERMTRRAYVSQIGDRVTATKRGASRVGTVCAVQRETSAQDARVEFVWVGGTGSDWPSNDYMLNDFTILRDYGPSSVRTLAEDVPEHVRGQWYYVLSGDTVTPATAAQDATQSPEESPEVRSLRRDLERAQRLADGRLETIDAMRADLAIIGDSLKATANRQEWCGEYERHLEELLSQLSGHSDDILREHAERAQDYRVTFTFSTTVRAASREAAIEEAQEMDWTYDGDWEAEED